MKNYRKIFIPKANGYIYVEKFGKGEEDGRAKIYDSNWQYLDYLDTEHITKQTYKEMIKQLQRARDMDDFAENSLCCETFDCGFSAGDVIDAMHDNEFVGYEDYEDCKQIIDELKNDYATLSDADLCRKYDVNRVGDWYIFLGAY